MRPHTSLMSSQMQIFPIEMQCETMSDQWLCSNQIESLIPHCLDFGHWILTDRSKKRGKLKSISFDLMKQTETSHNTHALSREQSVTYLVGQHVAFFFSFFLLLPSFDIVLDFNRFFIDYYYRSLHSQFVFSSIGPFNVFNVSFLFCSIHLYCLFLSQ